jgi:hypothetical protein
MIASSLSVTLNSSRLALSGTKERSFQELQSNPNVESLSTGRQPNQHDVLSSTLFTEQS